MTVSIDILQTWMNSREDEHLEFKEAKKNFHFETLVKYLRRPCQLRWWEDDPGINCRVKWLAAAFTQS